MPWFCGNKLTSNTSYPLQHITDQVWPMNYSRILREATNLQGSNYVGLDRYLNESDNTNIMQASDIDPNTNETLCLDSDTNLNQTLNSMGDLLGIYNTNLSETHSYNETCFWENPIGANNPLNGLPGYTFPIEDPTFAYVQFCLAQTSKEYCKVSFSTLVLSIVIFCNILKTSSFIILLLLPKFAPIGTSISFSVSSSVHKVRYCHCKLNTSAKYQWF